MGLYLSGITDINVCYHVQSAYTNASIRACLVASWYNIDSKAVRFVNTDGRFEIIYTNERSLV